MVRNIIFDISGILISSDEKDTINYYSKKLNISLGNVKGAHSKYMDSYERGELTDEEFKNLFFGELGVEVDPDYWDVKLSFKKKFDEVFRFVNDLRRKYPVYFISNEGKGYWKAVEQKFKITEIFIGGTLSFQARVRKPDARIFKMLITRNELIPEECVFIDDSERNLSGAEKFGMKSLHYLDLEQLKEDLKKMGVES